MNHEKWVFDNLFDCEKVNGFKTCAIYQHERHRWVFLYLQTVSCPKTKSVKLSRNIRSHLFRTQCQPPPNIPKANTTAKQHASDPSSHTNALVPDQSIMHPILPGDIRHGTSGHGRRCRRGHDLRVDAKGDAGSREANEHGEEETGLGAVD